MGLKIAFIGAGSIGFTRRLVADLLTVPAFEDAEIRLMDIDRTNLERVSGLVARDLIANGKSRVSIINTLDQRQAVTGAKYVLSVARIGGLAAFHHDVEIPLRFGVDQCVGDTICAGGIMYGQRTIPFILQWDESMDIGSDTLTGVNDADYLPPFVFTGKLNKVTLTIDRPQLSPEDVKKLQAAQRNNRVSE